jgi:hypothetical protein
MVETAPPPASALPPQNKKPSRKGNERGPADAHRSHLVTALAAVAVESDADEFFCAAYVSPLDAHSRNHPHRDLARSSAIPTWTVSQRTMR